MIVLVLTSEHVVFGKSVVKSCLHIKLHLCRFALQCCVFFISSALSSPSLLNLLYHRLAFAHSTYMTFFSQLSAECYWRFFWR